MKLLGNGKHVLNAILIQETVRFVLITAITFLPIFASLLPHHNQNYSATHLTNK